MGRKEGIGLTLHMPLISVTPAPCLRMRKGGALQNPPFLPLYVGLKMGGRRLLMERSDTGFLGTTQHLSHLHKQRLGLWGLLSEAGLSEAG